jgi:hypothetical protein
MIRVVILQQLRASLLVTMTADSRISTRRELGLCQVGNFYTVYFRVARTRKFLLGNYSVNSKKFSQLGSEIFSESNIPNHHFRPNHKTTDRLTSISIMF